MKYTIYTKNGDKIAVLDVASVQIASDTVSFINKEDEKLAEFILNEIVGWRRFDAAPPIVTGVVH